MRPATLSPTMADMNDQQTRRTEPGVAVVDPRPGPVSAAERITSLDAIRGIALLGILPMNALFFGLASAAYFNVSADGVEQPLDWVIGVLTMLFVDQKMMALFSLLFGVGVVIFAERGAAKGRRVVWLSLWRFGLLLVIGLVHAEVFAGDVLALYALCAPVVLLLRRLPTPLLFVIGAMCALAGTVAAPFVQSTIGADGAGLDEFWFTDGDPLSGAIATWFYADAFGRALGLMLIGVALFRIGIVQGERSDGFYRRLAWCGVGVGTAITSIGMVVQITSDWSPDIALVGRMPTGLGTIPTALGYMAVIILWNRRDGRHVERVRNVGRMALSNYLAQTALGVVTLSWWLSDAVDLTRTMIAVWIVGVWALQLWWSTWWLSRLRYGPFEWAWRCATYRTIQPLRRRPSTS